MSFNVGDKITAQGINLANAEKSIGSTDVGNFYFYCYEDSDITIGEYSVNSGDRYFTNDYAYAYFRIYRYENGYWVEKYNDGRSNGGWGTIYAQGPKISGKIKSYGKGYYKINVERFEGNSNFYILPFYTSNWKGGYIKKINLHDLTTIETVSGYGFDWHSGEKITANDLNDGWYMTTN